MSQWVAVVPRYSCWYGRHYSSSRHKAPKVKSHCEIVLSRDDDVQDNEYVLRCENQFRRS